MDFGFAFLREVVIKWLLFGVIGGSFIILPCSWTASGRSGTTRTARCTTCSRRTHVVRA